MNTTAPSQSRRSFLRTTTQLTAGLAGLTAGLGTFATAADAAVPAMKDGVYVIGPTPGYSPQIGTLVSMLNYNRFTILNMTKAFTKQELDFLLDPKANTIGALLMHLGATETFYQANTFEGRQDFNDAEKKEWGAAMELGDEGRKQIKGNEIKYYVDKITPVREKTLATLKTKDDAWLLAVDPEWSKEEPLNTYWKWFHVCEHESNHRGQIAFLKSRLPGAKASKE
ncbi:DinB family protein [Parachryseolinea silvisoli]|uniref:DinB family protein n=1 Tax=Parachryseolinea silvisoli TaxID=2873601 RepID=UPI002265BA36|nr:DinB family protein [Parachryseolinea silvisoli]MCD9020092.1 DinB family protein [Parachryseolinea silvisoli]